MKRMIGLAATTAAVIAGGLTGDAFASTQYNARNPGWLGKANYYKVTGASSFYSSTLTIPGPTVYRSRAYRGTQRVSVTRYVYSTHPTNWGELYNTWSLAKTRAVSATIRPGYRRTFRAWEVDVIPDFNYRVVFRVAYYTASGRFLSSIDTDYNLVGDYQCGSGHCSIGVGRDGRANILLMY